MLHCAQKRVPNKTPCPWYTEENEIAKQRRRALEKLWRKSATRTPLNRSRYRAQVNLCNRLLSKAMSEYYTQTLAQSSGNLKQMRNSVNKILLICLLFWQKKTSLGLIFHQFRLRSLTLNLRMLTALYPALDQILRMRWRNYNHDNVFLKWNMQSWSHSHNLTQFMYRFIDCSNHQYCQLFVERRSVSFSFQNCSCGTAFEKKHGHMKKKVTVLTLLDLLTDDQDRWKSIWWLHHKVRCSSGVSTWTNSIHAVHYASILNN